MQKFFSFLSSWGLNRFCEGVEESWSLSLNQQRCSQLFQMLRFLYIYILCDRYQREFEWSQIIFRLDMMWFRRNHIIISYLTRCFTLTYMAWIAQNIVYKVVLGEGWNRLLALVLFLVLSPYFHLTSSNHSKLFYNLR